MHLTTLLCTLLLTLTSAKSSSKSRDAVLLSQVRTLTLHGSKLTTGRRNSPIPQLTCVGGNACKLYDLDVLRCKNSGSEYDVEDIQWTCQASLPPEFKLGSTEVVCEGYDSPEDPYVLKGSCGVEYRLVLTEMGWEKYGDKSKKGGFDSFRGSIEGGKGVGGTLFTYLFWAAFVAIIAAILYSVYNERTNPNRPRPPRSNNFWGGGGGGGGGGDNDDPPPPYTPRSPPRYSKPSSSSTPRSSNPLGGFWGGAATGGAAGYMAGQYMGSRNQQRQQQNMFNAGPSNYGGGGGGSSWFGGGGGSGGAGAGPSSAPAPSTSRYESTGFGGTRRR